MKKGFTLVELLSVLGIMALLLLIAVPTYLSVSNNIKENLYESKVKELLSKGESYAEDTNNYAFSVNRLLEEGKISPDDESGAIYDPRDKRKMNCDLIEVSYQNNQMESNLIPQSECLSDEEISSRYGLLKLVLKGNVNEKVEPDTWTNDSEVSVSYEINDKYKDIIEDITGLTWAGAEEKSCTKENIHDCDIYKVSTTTSASLTVRLVANIKLKDTTVTNNYVAAVYMDTEAPVLKQDSILVNNDVETNANKKVTFELSDNYGSGVASYALVTTKSCNNASYKDASDGTQTEYLDEQVYYVCAKDKVGNEKGYFDEGYQIDVKNVDKDKLKASLSITSKDTRYHSKDVKLTITTNKNASDLQMCISQTNYLQDCSFEKYSETKNITLNGDYDGSSKTVYVTIQDKAGNLSHVKATYSLYKYCSRVGSWQVVSNTKNTCPACGNAYYNISYRQNDYYFTSHQCSTKQEGRSCGLKSCDPVDNMNPNDYDSSKKVTCDKTQFQKLINNYIDRFKNALNYQSFRNALYDCGSVTSGILASSDNAYNILRNHSRTQIVSGSGKSGNCKCYYNKDSKSAEKTCAKSACNGEYENYVSGIIYSGRVFVLSATTAMKAVDWGTSSSKCGDDNGFGDCENEGSSWEKYGYRSIILSDVNNNAYEATGWGYCTRSTNAILNWDDCYSRDERKNRIASFQNSVRVGLFSYQNWEYNNEKNDRDVYSYQNGKVYVQIFVI